MAALSEPVRIKALCLLWDGKERCVCELMKALGVSQSCMSRHMGVLKAAGLVADRRDAQWVRYRRHPKLSRPIANIIKAVLASLEKGVESNA
ncbi:MAG: metalloregulator ArsR/SmtB family transcription factor [Alphaproteobacteria bacterium]|nr:metalloregulator ArsR/SmtB family transcription factor [Alphaproteobacteria bacterium]